MLTFISPSPLPNNPTINPPIPKPKPPRRHSINNPPQQNLPLLRPRRRRHVPNRRNWFPLDLRSNQRDMGPPPALNNHATLPGGPKLPLHNQRHQRHNLPARWLSGQRPTIRPLGLQRLPQRMDRTFSRAGPPARWSIDRIRGREGVPDERV